MIKNDKETDKDIKTSNTNKGLSKIIFNETMSCLLANNELKKMNIDIQLV